MSAGRGQINSATSPAAAAAAVRAKDGRAFTARLAERSGNRFGRAPSPPSITGPSSRAINRRSRPGPRDGRLPARAKNNNKLSRRRRAVATNLPRKRFCHCRRVRRLPRRRRIRNCIALERSKHDLLVHRDLSGLL